MYVKQAVLLIGSINTFTNVLKRISKKRTRTCSPSTPPNFPNPHPICHVPRNPLTHQSNFKPAPQKARGGVKRDGIVRSGSHIKRPSRLRETAIDTSTFVTRTLGCVHSTTMTTPSRMLIGPLLLSLLVSMATAAGDKDATDDEIQEKCGFSLEKIHDCKYSACLSGKIKCEQEGKDQTEIADCQADQCINGKIECEKPLDEYLTKEQVCEGDKFSAVDGQCMKNHRASLNDLIDCKTIGYLEAKKNCFKSEYHDMIQKEAEKKFGESTCSEALVCTLDSCYDDIKDCLQEYHRNMSRDPGKYRKFDLEECAFVAIGYPHSLIVGAVVAVVIIIGLILGGIYFYRRRNSRRRHETAAQKFGTTNDSA
uniref:uncharacterized protein isoform X2 n=1 Tax=Myxine glutinosa TaxID=7769 RepID=UPI00358F912B